MQTRRPPLPQDISTPQAGHPATSTQGRTPPPGPPRLSPTVRAGTQVGGVGRSGDRSAAVSRLVASPGTAASEEVPPVPAPPVPAPPVPPPPFVPPVGLALASVP